jgi:glucokinase
VAEGHTEQGSNSYLSVKPTRQATSGTAADRAAFIGLDIGNTRLTAAVVLRDGSFIHTEEQPAPSDQGAEATVARLIEMADRAVRAASERALPPAGIGLGFGGPVDYRRQAIRQSFHSSGWHNLPLAGTFQEHFHIPSLLDNDANAAGLAEALFGAARDSSVSLYVNVGTGIGGAIIIDGEVHHGATGSAGEIGHTVVDPEGPVCSCGKRGCVEAVASGSAIARMAEAAGITPPESAGELRGQDVTLAAREGDKVCAAIVHDAAEALGVAIANAVSLLDPDIVVLGGGVPEAGETWLRPLRQSFSRHAVSPPAQEIQLVVAHLGYRAGVMGAAALGMQAARQSERQSHT